MSPLILHALEPELFAIGHAYSFLGLYTAPGGEKLVKVLRADIPSNPHIVLVRFETHGAVESGMEHGVIRIPRGGPRLRSKL